MRIVGCWLACLVGGALLAAPAPTPRLPRILALGDSLTRNGYASLVARDLRMNLVTAGIGGQNAAQVAARFGAIRTVAVVADRRIVAGDNDLTMLAPDLLAGSDRATRSIAVRVDGVAGTLSRSTDAAGIGHNRFRPDAGQRVPHPLPPSVSVMVTPDPEPFDILLLCVGRNGATSDPERYLGLVDAILAHAKTRARHIVLLNIPTSAKPEEAPGTPGHARIAAINRALAARYPDLILDIDSIYAAAPAARVRADPIHYNPAGARLWADAVTAFIRRKGWAGNRVR